MSIPISNNLWLKLRDHYPYLLDPHYLIKRGWKIKGHLLGSQSHGKRSAQRWVSRCRGERAGDSCVGARRSPFVLDNLKLTLAGRRIIFGADDTRHLFCWSGLLESGKLLRGLLQEFCVGIGVGPHAKEVLIGVDSSAWIALRCKGASKAEPR
jgi:hypothetical protein